jgi:hypothetical protein
MTTHRCEWPCSKVAVAGRRLPSGKRVKLCAEHCKKLAAALKVKRRITRLK